MDVFKLSRQWFDYCFENPEKIKPIHTALYFFAIEHCNRLGWKKKFGLPTEMTKDAIGVKSWHVYIAAFNDLIDWGFFELIERSKNQYSSNIIALIENNKANNKALDKAMIKHASKQQQSTHQSNDSIDIQETIIQETKEIVYNSFYDEQIELSNKDLNYIQFVKVLFGENPLSMPLNNVLSLPKQVTFEQYKRIHKYKEENKIVITPTLVAMENHKDLKKKYVCVQATLLNWLKPKK